jgi:starch phosphorylase
MGITEADVTYDIRFYGQAEKMGDGSGRAIWHGGQELLALAYEPRTI